MKCFPRCNYVIDTVFNVKKTGFFNVKQREVKKNRLSGVIILRFSGPVGWNPGPA
jgi:hypothetical protein